MKKKVTIGLILLFTCFSIYTGTEPDLPPYYLYNILGQIECDTSNTKSNYPILLFAKEKEESAFRLIIGSSELGYQHSADLTDYQGKFSLSLNHITLFDSLKVGYIDNKNNVRFSRGYKVDPEALGEVLGLYTPPQNSGCTSCSTEPTEYRLDHYYYKLENVVLNVCQ